MSTRTDAGVGSQSEPARVDLLGYKNIVILTDGASRSSSAKTATGLLRYRQQDIAAVLDRSEKGTTTGQLFGVGGDIPVVGSVAEAPDADALFIGIAPAGGKLPEAWKPIMLEAISSGVDIVSGLHDFLVNDGQLVAAASQHEAKLIDVRRNREHTVAGHATFPANNLRIHTVGHDCSVGKMVVSLELANELQQRGANARFLATGQTGIMIGGDGVPVDCVVADFVSGAVEQLLLRNTDAEIMLIEGQGSLSHPSFSGVTLGLLHGCAPQGLVLCYEAGRTAVKELAHVPLKPLDELVRLYETVGSLRYPCRVIGVAINGRKLDDAALDEEVGRVQDELGLPACDVYRHGAGVLADAVEKFRAEVIG
ncbi:DUF1611 domain-containing protein [Aeoliella sp. ICT_H6.2]|uniref:DUF1611 domain-containing protein n=1 Tax=Aeoliella straminimaris TaxID=2954799 RepID=A0A9X2FI38_9BACT|nr:DUF1611 domain-containing protein [Aeoliella straminimaris]MCO6045526.1 DUF1611 domain-containing protein [Aeoliella straminimaris]